MPYEYRKAGNQYQLHYSLGGKSAVLATMSDIAVRVDRDNGMILVHGRPASVRNSDAGLHGGARVFTITSNTWNLDALNKLIDKRGHIDFAEEKVRHAAQKDDQSEQVSFPRM